MKYYVQDYVVTLYNFTLIFYTQLPVTKSYFLNFVFDDKLTLHCIDTDDN